MLNVYKSYYICYNLIKLFCIYSDKDKTSQTLIMQYNNRLIRTRQNLQMKLIIYLFASFISMRQFLNTMLLRLKLYSDDTAEIIYGACLMTHIDICMSVITILTSIFGWYLLGGLRMV